MAAQDVYEISVRIGLVHSLLGKSKMVGYSALTMVSASSKLNVQLAMTEGPSCYFEDEWTKWILYSRGHINPIWIYSWGAIIAQE